MQHDTENAHPAPGRSESERIEFLLRRDGYAATRAWVERTLGLYRDALSQGGSGAAEPVYRARFDRAIHEFEDWLEANPHDLESPDPEQVGDAGCGPTR